MRALLVTLALVGCTQKKEPAPQPPPPSPSVAPVATPIDAAPPDAPPDADQTFALLEGESLGGIKTQAPAADVIRTLGEPKKKTKPHVEGATGSAVSDWDWPSASAIMTADTEKGPWTLRSISVNKQSKLETVKHIKIGSSRAEVEKLYPRSDDDQQQDPNSYLAGSVYGGVMFGFDHDKVVSIAMGPFAF